MRYPKRLVKVSSSLCQLVFAQAPTSIKLLLHWAWHEIVDDRIVSLEHYKLFSNEIHFWLQSSANSSPSFLPPCGGIWFLSGFVAVIDCDEIWARIGPYSIVTTTSMDKMQIISQTVSLSIVGTRVSQTLVFTDQRMYSKRWRRTPPWKHFQTNTHNAAGLASQEHGPFWWFGEWQTFGTVP